MTPFGRRPLGGPWIGRITPIPDPWEGPGLGVIPPIPDPPGGPGLGVIPPIPDPPGGPGLGVIPPIPDPPGGPGLGVPPIPDPPQGVVTPPWFGPPNSWVFGISRVRGGVQNRVWCHFLHFLPRFWAFFALPRLGFTPGTLIRLVERVFEALFTT